MVNGELRAGGASNEAREVLISIADLCDLNVDLSQAHMEVAAQPPDLLVVLFQELEPEQAQLVDLIRLEAHATLRLVRLLISSY